VHLLRETDITFQTETAAPGTPQDLRPKPTRVLPPLRPLTVLDIPTELSDRIYSAARQDLEFKSRLTVARHHIENLLPAFSHAVATRDEDSRARIIRTTRISVEEAKHASEGLCALNVIDWLAPWSRNVLLTANGLSVQFSGRSVLYAAAYQTWEISTEANSSPVCTSIGSLHGCLKPGPQVWRWTEHTMRHLLGQAGDPTAGTSPEAKEPGSVKFSV
jgi:hypothetical protein